MDKIFLHFVIGELMFIISILFAQYAFYFEHGYWPHYNEVYFLLGVPVIYFAWVLTGFIHGKIDQGE